MRYEPRASDRDEMFARGSLVWPDPGIVVNEGHDGIPQIIRASPFVKDDPVVFDFSVILTP